MDDEKSEDKIDGNSEEKSKGNSAESSEIKSDESSKAEQQEHDPKNITYIDNVAVYTDPKTGYQYQWDATKKEWSPRTPQTAYGYENDTHTYTDADGAKYFWDKEKNAWFPKIDDDFMAQYQMNYGFVDNQGEKQEKVETKTVVVTEAEEEGEDKDESAAKKKKIEQKPAWFDLDEQHNTKVYVSNLPTDVTLEEFVDLMQKCGLVMRDPSTGSMKAKLYTDPGTNYLKGDALCTYIKIESVDLALKLLDGSTFKGKKIKVERAKFQMKGEYDPSLKPKKKKKKEKDKLKKMQEKLFDWRPEKMRGERAKHEKVVIVKNLFEPNLFDTEVHLILEYQQDLREECSKCGSVRRVVLYDRHPDGVAQISMKEPEEADEVVKLLNGRWFGKRQLTAEIWDGKTKYKIGETDAQITERLEGWDKFLEDTVGEDKGGGVKGRTKNADPQSSVDKETT